jgi:hypothetical protein
MRRIIVIAAFAVLSIFVAASASAAQDTTCSSVVTDALNELSNNCGDLSRNSACYGYNNVMATFFSSLAPDAFTQPNDRVDLAELQSITTAPLDPVTSQWGIAVVKAQANLPDSLPGQAVTLLLLGDVQVTTGVEQGSDQKPMQAIYFTTGLTGTQCNDVPESSLIIQGPQNITVNMRVNGADIALSSTLVFNSTENNTMECGVIDGQAIVGGDQIIPAGFVARVPLDQGLNVSGSWGGNVPMEEHESSTLQILEALPDGVLNYTPDVPTPEEVSMLAALHPRLVPALDSHILRAMVRLLITAGATPEMLGEWDEQTLRNYVANHADALPEATAEPNEATPAPTVEDILSALDTYLAQ